MTVRRGSAPATRSSGSCSIPPIGASGTYAEYVAVTADAPLARIPDGVDPLDDQVVLIVGAGGGVGTSAAQFAVNAGARVIASIDALAESRMRSYGVTETVVRPQVPATKDTARFGTVRQTPENVSSPVIAPRSGGLSQRHGSRSSTVLPSLLPPSPPGYSNTEREPETSWCVGLTGTWHRLKMTIAGRDRKALVFSDQHGVRGKQRPANPMTHCWPFTGYHCKGIVRSLLVVFVLKLDLTAPHLVHLTSPGPWFGPKKAEMKVPTVLIFQRGRRRRQLA